MRALGTILIGCALLGGGSACGGGGNSDALRAKHVGKPEAQRRAKSMLLRLADFPDGWRASAGGQDAGGQRAFRKCIGLDYSDLTLAGDATSKDFAMGENTTANSEAQVFASAEQAAKALRRFSQSMGDSAIKGCLKRFVEKNTPSDYNVGEIDVGELRFTAPTGVDAAKAWQIVIPFEPASSSAGLSVTGYLDIVVLVNGERASQVETSDVLTPFDSDLRNHLAQAVARRMSEGSPLN